jgi:hypothetical protein
MSGFACPPSPPPSFSALSLLLRTRGGRLAWRAPFDKLRSAPLPIPRGWVERWRNLSEPSQRRGRWGLVCVQPSGLNRSLSRRATPQWTSVRPMPVTSNHLLRPGWPGLLPGHLLYCALNLFRRGVDVSAGTTRRVDPMTSGLSGCGDSPRSSPRTAMTGTAASFAAVADFCCKPWLEMLD